ncbi:DNA-3-methyladenine glycosylase I [Ornithinicoccus halotolerans]|uniref:DNA-3-methyladenine glycosylase I n=1 Tax=Ornithinicoccus halotolerans TaxID=1748220 RepID=UPI001297CEC9|nr:DNA-3-methyladenine glycosylase I [Ornithinicoccus halotolerans]
MTGATTGPDGVARCPWPGLQDPLYRRYHDEEWGRPVRGEQPLLERLCLEAFQSGLSWLTILRKRPAFREAFAGFDPERVAAFTAGDVERLLADAGIVRNRRKIEATIGNARATLALREHGGLDALVWSYADPERPRPASVEQVPSRTRASTELAAQLRGYGFAHLGPVTVYAAMQACGLVDDHLVGCHRSRAA